MAPSGKLSTANRTFKEVVSDMRHVVFSVIRDRPNPAGGVNSLPMGTGFFVAKNIFVTCDHVISPQQMPHVPGDSYRLIANLTGQSASIHTVKTPEVGKDLIRFPNLDLAVLTVPDAPDDQPFVALLLAT